MAIPLSDAPTDRCAKKVKLFRAVFFELPTGDSTISSENTGIYRQMGHGNAINRLSENLTFFAQRLVTPPVPVSLISCGHPLQKLSSLRSGQ